MSFEFDVGEVVYQKNTFSNSSTGMSATFEKFISYVDSSYSLGQRYGQAIREIETPFRIADIEYYKDQKNIEVLE